MKKVLALFCIASSFLINSETISRAEYYQRGATSRLEVLIKDSELLKRISVTGHGVHIYNDALT